MGRSGGIVTRGRQRTADGVGIENDDAVITPDNTTGVVVGIRGLIATVRVTLPSGKEVSVNYGTKWLRLVSKDVVTARAETEAREAEVFFAEKEARKAKEKASKAEAKIRAAEAKAKAKAFNAEEKRFKAEAHEDATTRRQAIETLRKNARAAEEAARVAGARVKDFDARIAERSAAATRYLPHTAKWFKIESERLLLVREREKLVNVLAAAESQRDAMAEKLAESEQLAALAARVRAATVRSIDNVKRH